jgi:hypothetical protein
VYKVFKRKDLSRYFGRQVFWFRVKGESPAGLPGFFFISTSIVAN